MASVELVAVAVGFYGGVRIKVGERFTFTGDNVPKWASPPADAAKAIAEQKQAVLGDTKPTAARKVAAKRAMGEAVSQ